MQEFVFLIKSQAVLMPEFRDRTWNGGVLNLLSKKIKPYFKKPVQLVLLAPQVIIN